MSLPVYDSAKHHVGLGVDANSLKGFILNGAYRRDPQRQGGSTEYGGEGDVLSAGTAARWTQDDFSGGGYQQVFEDDPAMFADCQNFLPNLISRAARTVPPLEYFVDAAVSGAVTGPALPLGVFATGGKQITVVDEDQIRFYDALSGVRTIHTANDPDGDAGLDPSSLLYAATHDPADNLVYLIARRADTVEASNQLNGSITAGADELTMDSNSGFPTNGVVRIGSETIYYRGKSGGNKLLALQRGREGTDAASHDDNANVNFRRQFYLAKMSQADGMEWIGWIPNDAVGPPRGICVTAGRDVLIQMSTSLYLLDVNDARDSLTAVRVGRLPGQWRDAVTYNGQTYILLTDSEQHTSVVAWDGTQVLPVTDVPYNFLGKCLEVYAGRVYVGGGGADLNEVDRYAELYEVSGASLKLIKTFAAEARAGQTVPSTIFDMTVHEGLLFLGTNIGQLVAYDITRDALWPGLQIRDLTGRNLEARNLLSTREKLLAWCYDTNRTDPVDGFYRMATDDLDVEEAYTSSLTTSDFLPQPDRQKRWANLRLVTRYDTATFEVSQDGGATWASVSGVVAEAGDVSYTDYDLSALDPSSGIRFRFSMSNTTVDYGEIIAFTCRFYWLDSGKQAWSMTVLGTDQPEGVDGSALDQDVAALRSTLWSYWTDRTTLVYRDLDGTDHTVYVSDMSELQPIIADAVDENGTREAQYSLVLTEL